MKELTGILTCKPIIFLLQSQHQYHLQSNVYEETGSCFLIINIFKVFDQFLFSTPLVETVIYTAL